MSSCRMSLPSRSGTTHQYKRERGHGYDERNHRRYLGSGRYVNGDITRLEPQIKSCRDRDYDNYRHQERRRIPSTFSKTAFRNALQQLHTTLRGSIRFFRDFEENYLRETRAIKPYASARVMEELWTSKAVSSDRDPSSRPSQCRQSDQRGMDGKYAKPVFRGETFRDHIQYIKEDFENALNCGPRPYRKQPQRQRVGSTGCSDSVASARLDAESTERLMGKLAGQYKVLGKILCNIYKVRSYVQEFIKESELLASYLDKSRNLWKVEEQEQPRQRQRESQKQEREQGLPNQRDEQGYQSDDQDHGYEDDRESTSIEDSNQEQADEW